MIEIIAAFLIGFWLGGLVALRLARWALLLVLNP